MSVQSPCIPNIAAVSGRLLDKKEGKQNPKKARTKQGHRREATIDEHEERVAPLRVVAEVIPGQRRRALAGMSKRPRSKPGGNQAKGRFLGKSPGQQQRGVRPRGGNHRTANKPMTERSSSS